MRKKILCLILIAATIFVGMPFAAEKSALAAADLSVVRVLLSNSGSSTISISVKGNYFIQENGASFSGGSLVVKNSGGKVVVTHSALGQLYSGTTVNIMREQLTPSAGYMAMVVSSVTRYYLGHFTFKANGAGVRVINTVPLQHYLYGVVAFEMSNNFPIEALKAQAVAAKCYVLSGLTPTSEYDIGDTASDQVYKGYNSSYTSVIAAVDATYDVWLYLGNSILCAYFAASNGGAMILPSDTWTGTNRYIWDSAYTRAADPYDIANPLSVQETAFMPSNGDAGNITAVLSNYLRGRVAMLLRQNGTIPADASVIFINAIHDVISKSNTTANISVNVTVQSSDGSQAALDFAYTEDFAWFVSNGVFVKPQTLRLYTVTKVTGGFQILRGRYGHGVGLSQRGAEQMANQGMKYDKILKFYYPGATLKSMGLTMPSDPTKPGGTATSPQLGSVIATGVTTGSVNFRQGASASTTSFGLIAKGTTIDIYAQENGFSLTVINGQAGYISNTYLKITPVSSTSTPDTSTTTGTTTVSAYGEVTSSTLNFRDKANTSGKILQTLKKGAKIDIYSYADSSATWFYCSSNGKTGYVSAQYVKILSTTTTTDTSTGSSTTTAVAGSTGVVNTEGVMLQKSNGDRVAQISKGVTVTIISEDANYYYVSCSGNGKVYEGYLLKSYVTVSSNGTTTTTTTSGASTGVTTGKVNLRSGPGTNKSVITTMAKGASVTILGSDGDWYYVDYNGQKGYASKPLVKASASSSTSSKTGVTTAKVNFRTEPNSNFSKNIISTLVKGTTVTILSTSNGWHKVSYNGTEGYLYASYVKVS